jgi:hypothetical protein
LSRVVIPGLVPGIHVLSALRFTDVDGRHKAGHDGRRDSRAWQDLEGRVESLGRYPGHALFRPML